jgi:sugar lactone lactonase YvrE
MERYDVKRVLDVKAELGECPLWCVEDQCLYWIDIENSTINRFDPQTGKNDAWKVPATPGCFALRDGNGAVIAARDGFYDIDFAIGSVKRVMSAVHDAKQLRFNDGRTDRQGRFVAGTVDGDLFNPTSTAEKAYYRFDGRSIEKIIAPIHVANGTAFSLDVKTIYRAESMDRRIFAYDYDPATGTASRERVFAIVPDTLGVPDGATVDSEDAYWVALPAGPKGAGVARYTPDGRLDHYFEVPVLISTMIAFGGPNMSTLYITSGRLEEYLKYKALESAGGLFAVETEFRGVPETKFRYR